MIINKYGRWLSIILSTSVSGLTFAGSMGDVAPESALSGLYLAISAGPSWASNSDSNQRFVVGASQYSYHFNSPSTNGLWGVSLGKEFQFHGLGLAQFGLAYYGYGSFSRAGHVTQGADAASSDVYPFNYHISSQQLMAEGKALATFYNFLHPYAQIGLGVSFNKASGYRVNVPFFETFSPQFSDNSHNSFAYNLGLGMDVDLATHWRGGIGYRFSGLGNGNLGKGRIDDVAIRNTLNSNLYTNSVLAQVTYII